MSPPALSVVVIGRNEGGRLTTCLQSVLAARMPHPVELIYVDSHSTDDSPVRAQALGATVVALSAGALSAARARNAGWRAATAPFILFLDGDTVLHADFIQRAFPEFVNPDVAVVWGHRRELRPHASVYNRVLDLDWIAPPGYSEFCGGDSLMRRERLECTGGFDPDLIAGEEPDLCRRIRGGGGRILHVDVPMTGHDFAIRHFSQYWRRAVRTGYAYAEVSARYRHSPDPLWTRDAGINLRRGPLYLLVGVGLTATALVAQSLLPLVAAALAGAIVATRTAVLARWKKAPWGTLMLFGIHSHLQHVPIWQGQMLYLWARWRGRKRELIEYKKYFLIAPLMAFVWLFAAGQGPVTTITIDSHLLRPKVQRFGINLSDQTYYDGGQLARNLVLRNPGFEGGLYNSIIRCTSGTATTCMDDNANSTWPEGFWNGSRFEVFHGVARGRTGLVRSYTRADGTRGGVLAFARSGIAPSPGDYLIVRTTRPGGATAGWWPTTTGNASIAANRVDLPPGSVGAQTVALRAPAVTDSATLAAYFDRHASRSFVLLHGEFRLSFRAKGTSGTSAVAVTLQRLGLTTYLDQIVPLTERWEHYTFTFSAAERGSSLDAVALKFSTVGQDAFLLDDVELVQTDSAFSNRTVFRDPVVQTLQSLRPGVLRLWAGQLGDTLDNLIAEPFARQRSGYLAWEDEHEDISYGLHEFLELCAVVGADPWFVVPATFSTTDASNLIDYLAGDASSVYGAKRAARGHPAPWTSAFSRIHLEFGNEAWNATFKGGTIEYPEAYGQRARVVFAAMRRSTSYSPAAFDLVLGGQAVSPDRNRVIQDNCDNNDSFAVAPYMMNAVDAFADQESLYGSTFAEPEAFVSTHGSAEGVTGGLVTLNQQAIRASSHPVPLTVYEINLSTLSGTITQTALDSYVSSLGAGLAVVDAMLHNMRHGVATQNLWNLSQYNYTREDKRTVNLWGAVVDMGATNRRRPQFLALQLANDAIGAGSNMLRTVHQGEDPTWDQPMVNSVRLAGAHYLQSFAFSNGATSSVIVFNLHRTAALRVNFGGSHAPSGTVITQQLSAPSPGDTNESAEKVRIVRRVIEDYGGDTVRLPAHSMTSFTWTPGTTR